jgi:hypothetical protein
MALSTQPILLFLLILMALQKSRTQFTYPGLAPSNFASAHFFSSWRTGSLPSRASSSPSEEQTWRNAMRAGNRRNGHAGQFRFLTIASFSWELQRPPIARPNIRSSKFPLFFF